MISFTFTTSNIALELNIIVINNIHTEVTFPWKNIKILLSDRIPYLICSINIIIARRDCLTKYRMTIEYLQ